MKRQDEQFSEKEARQRFQRTLRAALSTPPTHLKDIPKKRSISKRKNKRASTSTEKKTLG